MTQATLTDCNRLGLDYRAEAEALPYAGPIIDAHIHLSDIDAAEVFFDAADAFGVGRVISQTSLEQVDALQEAYGSRILFVAIPQYFTDDPERSFTTDWYERLETFYQKGSRMFKIWAGPRGIDRSDHLRLDAPARLEAIRIAKEIGYTAIMTHVGDPDTWYQTIYADSAKYGTKQSHMDTLAGMIEAHGDRPWLGAHMGGMPEDLEQLQSFLDRFPTYVIDTSATKWMVRELSQRADEFADFVKRNPGRVLWGTDIVAHKLNALAPEEVKSLPAEPNRPPIEPDEEAGYGFELYSSRFWAMRKLMETRHEGPSPIVDPDLSKVDPSVDPKSSPTLRGAALDEQTLRLLYHDNAAAFIERVYGA